MIELEESEHIKTSFRSVEIEESLRRNVYSNAEEFRDEMLKL